MIIRYPTGLYKSVLPAKPADSQSVTYTISNAIPPRTDLVFPKISTGIRLRQRVPRNIPEDVVRDSLGQLVFTSSQANRTTVGDSKKAYEVGQVLDFEFIETQEITPMLVQERSTVRHSNNLFDYTSLGMTTEEASAIELASIQSIDILTSQLNASKVKRANAELVISAQQKLINEAKKTVQSLDAIMSASGSDLLDVKTKVQAALDQALVDLEEAKIAANEAASEAERLFDAIRTVSVSAR